MKFSLGAILTVTTDIRLIQDWGEIYELFFFLEGRNVWTHELPSLADKYTPILLRQHPELNNIFIGAMSEEEVIPTMMKLERIYGKELEITR